MIMFFIYFRWPAIKMTIILEVSTSDRGQQSNNQSSSASKSNKHNASKSTKEAKLKNKVRRNTLNMHISSIFNYPGSSVLNL